MRSRRFDHAAVGIAAIACGYIAWIAYSGFLFADDYFALSDAAGSRLDGHFLLQNVAGHLSVGTWFVWWLWAHFAGLNFDLIMATVLGGYFLALLVVWALVRKLAGKNMAALAIFAIAALSPTVAPSIFWIANAVSAVPLEAAMAGALLLHFKGISESRRHIAFFALSALCTLIGVMFFELALIIPLLLFLLTYSQATLDNTRQRVREVGMAWPSWVFQVIAVGLYLALRLTGSYGSPSQSSPSLLINYAFRSFVSQIAPATIGGPLNWRVVVGGQPWAVMGVPTWFDVLAIVTLSIAIVVATYLLPRVAYLIASFVLYAMASLIVVGLGRVTSSGIPGTIMDPRYIADLTVPFAAILALGVQGFRTAGRLSGAQSGQRKFAFLLPIPILFFSCTSIYNYRQWWSVAPTKSWIQTAEAAIKAHPQASVFDSEVPASFGGTLQAYVYNRASTVLRPLGNVLDFTDPNGKHYIFNSLGNLVPARFVVYAHDEYAACGTGNLGARVVLPIPKLQSPLWTIIVKYETVRGGSGALNVANYPYPVDLRKGSGAFLVYPGTPSSIIVLSENTRDPVCIDEVDEGIASPTPSKDSTSATSRSSSTNPTATEHRQ